MTEPTTPPASRGGVASDDVAPANLATALAAFQARLPHIRKGETAKVTSDKGNYSYTYANLADISALVMPLLGEFGLSFLAKPTFVDGGRFVLAYKLMHTSGEFEAGEWPLPSGGTPQALGSAITYGRRYTLCAVTGVSPDDADDDGAAASGRQEQQPQYERQGPPPPLTATSSAADIRAAIKAEGDTRSLSVPELAEDFYARTSEQIRDAASAVLFDYYEALVARATAGQHRQMHALWKQAEITDRDARLKYTSEAIERELTTSADLTKSEAATVIGKLTSFCQQAGGAS